ncbi:MAG TPA: ribosome biogenesis GTPase Der [Deltaproteobacteria bacterium]|nr:ribosome biogenesis GTPase Der [Deltaproteobacteria bacterium]HPJ94940.1 ribosome biogenesis GTPase Der [Deltaproteobacteria bacterium]
MSVVAIVGRPNVGKSTLFNSLIGQRRAIVGPERGITRDRLYARLVMDDGIEVDLVDTGGFDTITDGSFARSMREQTLQAIGDADIIVCLFDTQTGITPDDEELVKTLRQSGADVIYVANKVDDPNLAAASAWLYELGLDDFIEISARKKTGLERLIEQIKAHVRKHPREPIEDETDAVRVSILGRPNVGKSLLLNKIIGENRAIVSDEAGTTRDYVDIRIAHEGKEYVFVDTAGIRRKSRIQDSLERLSVMRSLQNVNMSHICLLLVDPFEGVTDQDKRLCRIIMEHGRGFMLIVNKSDLIDTARREEIRRTVRHDLRFLPDVKVVFISALTGKNVARLYPMIDSLFEKTTMNIPTAKINRVFADIVSANPPPAVKGRQLKFFYINQTGTVPPQFRVVSNFPKAVPENYHRYLSHALKKACGMEGISIKLFFAGK